MSNDRIVVIGGVAAGMSAAAKAARVKPDARITVFTNEIYISYGACGFPYFLAGEIENEAKLVARSIEQFRAQNIDVRVGHEVLKINPADKKVSVKKLGTVEEVDYDKLIIATGASPFIPPVEGVNLRNVFVLRNMGHAMELKNYISREKPKNAVIVGGGYIGLEMAEMLLKLGCKVAIVELAPQIVPNMDEDMAAILKEYLEKNGVEVFTAEKLMRIEGREAVEKVVTDKRELVSEMVLLAVGTVPNSKLAEDAGIELGIRNAIKVNTRMETSIPDIYAAGDCATVRHRLTGEDVYIPLGTTANKQGRVAGENAAGGNAEFAGVLGTGIAKVMNMEIARTGLSARELQQHGIEYVETVILARTKAGYYPGSEKIYIKLIAGKQDGKLWGAQIVGGAGAGKRIDVFAACMHLGATVDAVQDMDLAYAPPFSPVYDAILVGLTDLQKKLKRV
ncbi:FAD-dependent oxidoreductase [Thermincola ferriacetica]